ncbi:ABC transporter permease [Devosia nitrariae]|uniref:ABC transporter permease n=1 Tax=Devosia nitrariae TaxID=2071872 RepID=A0ABQ5VZW5_9HYPH|nr:ABC transporter permease [Devosia nitrariae]GLQ53148.1 ABC transporter permease [Devosia nitrariae]
MAGYVLQRLLLVIPTVFVISIITFVIIQLPPGDFLTSYIATLESGGQVVDQAQIDALRAQYGLGEPVYVQYWKWVVGVLSGDFGHSFQWKRPVVDLIGERMALTIALSVASLLLVWAISLPIGIYSAVRQYSPGDYFFTFISFVGLGVPNFLFALVLMWWAYSQFGMSVGGLFSPQYADAPWSLAKVLDFLSHLWIPAAVLAIGGIAGLIRIMRANLLDELPKLYVTTARAKGMGETSLVLKYPVRVALNPFVSTIGWTLPGLVSGSIIVSVVLNLPTTGPMLLTALQSQDMYLAGAILLMLSILTVIGTLISDVLLAWLDPRIRFN